MLRARKLSDPAWSHHQDEETQFLQSRTQCWCLRSSRAQCAMLRMSHLSCQVFHLGSFHIVCKLVQVSTSTVASASLKLIIID
jgi:hypothetical protein